MSIQVATREEYRLVFGIARIAARDEATLAAINKVANYQEALWSIMDQVQIQSPEASTRKAPPSTVETHGVDSPEAIAMQERRRAARQAAKEAAPVVDGLLDELKEDNSASSE